MPQTEANPAGGRHLLITAGPTHEPIDAVRYIGNRSSGRLGVSLADEAARRGWRVTLLLGPTPLTPSDVGVRTLRYRTTADLEGLLEKELPGCDVLVMAAAVADYRPRATPDQLAGKLRRESRAMIIELEPTPDLLAACSSRRRTGQVLIGFALEPEAELLASARRKLERKRVDAIIANPLETMESPDVRAIAVLRGGAERDAGPAMPKAKFAGWLMDLVEELADAARA